MTTDREQTKKEKKGGVMKRAGIIGLTVLVLGLLVVGFAVPALASPWDNGSGNAPGARIGSPLLVRVADALGVDTTELSTRIDSGETLAAIAADLGVSEDTLIEAIVAPQVERVTLGLDNGTITEDEAATILESAREHAAWLIEQDLSAGFDWEETHQFCQGLMGEGFGYGRGSGGYGQGTGPGNGPCGGGEALQRGYGPNTSSDDEAPARGNSFNRFGGGMMGGGMMRW
jgi:transcriptional regulator with XRE-family HTH domain